MLCVTYYRKKKTGQAATPNIAATMSLLTLTWDEEPAALTSNGEPPPESWLDFWVLGEGAGVWLGIGGGLAVSMVSCPCPVLEGLSGGTPGVLSAEVAVDEEAVSDVLLVASAELDGSVVVACALEVSRCVLKVDRADVAGVELGDSVTTSTPQSCETPLPRRKTPMMELEGTMMVLHLSSTRLVIWSKPLTQARLQVISEPRFLGKSLAAQPGMVAT